MPISGYDFAGPGDVFHTKGVGILGWIIRSGTGAAEGHSGIIHAHLGLVPTDFKSPSRGYNSVQAANTAALNARLACVSTELTHLYVTAEAWAEGVRFRLRTAESITSVQRVWTNAADRQAILARSTKFVEDRTKYDYSEIARIALRIIGLKFPKRDLEPDAVICSHHAAECVVSARPALEGYFLYPTMATFPGELHNTLDVVDWIRDRISELPAKTAV